MAQRRIDINVNANVGNVPQAMNQIGQAIQNTTNQVKSTVGPFANLQKDFSATANMSKIASTGITNFGNSAQASTTKLQGFGKVFSDNRGIVFGVAGLTSALGEAVGMMGMYGDTAQRLGEAQDKLNQLIDKGVTSGKAYTDAQAEVTKQQRFFNMVQRNTILSQMDMIFFTTMVISGLVKLATNARNSTGFISKLANVFKIAKVEAVTMDGALLNNARSMNMANQASTGLGRSIGFLGISLKGMLIGTGIGAAAVGIGLLIQKFMEWQDQVAETEKKNKQATDNIRMDLEVWGRITQQTGEDFLKNWEGMSDASQEHAAIIVDSILNIAKQQEISNVRAAMYAANNMQIKELETQFMIQQDLDQIESARQANLAKSQIAGRPHLAKAYSQQTEAETKLNQLMKESKARSEDYGKTITALAQKLAGLETNTIDFTNVQQELTDNIQVAKSEAMTADTAFKTMFNNFLVGGNQMATAQEVMAGVNTTLNELVARGKISGEQAKVIGAQWETSLGLADQGAKKATETFGNMSQAVQLLYQDTLKLVDPLEKLAETEAGKQFWTDFNNGSTTAVSIMEQAKVKVAEFFAKWKTAIAAGMNPQEKFNELLATMPVSYREAMKVAFDKYLKDQASAAKEDKKELADVTKEIDKQKEALLDSVKAMSERGLRATMDIKQNELLTQAYDNTIGSIIEESKAIKAKTEIMATLSTWNKKNLDEANAILDNEADRIVILEDSTQGEQARTEARREGIQAASDWLTQILKNNIAMEEERTRIQSLVETMYKGIEVDDLTTEKLKELAEVGLNNTTDSVNQLVQAFLDGTAQAKQFFSSIITAKTDKDFGKQWKDLKKMFPKSVQDDVKKIFEAFKEGNKHMEKARTQLNFVQSALFELSESDVDTILHNTFNEMKKMHDPETLTSLNAYKEMFKDVEENAKSLPATFNSVWNSMSDGRITADEAAASFVVWQIETGKITKLTDDQRAALDKAGITYDETTGKITQLSAEQQAAYDKMSTEAVVVETIANMWLLLTNTIAEANDLVVTDWADTGVEILQKAAITDQAVFDMWNLVMGGVEERSLAMAQHWSKMMQSVMKNASAGGNGIIKNFNAALNKVAGLMLALAKHWSKMCNSMIANAKSAASGINSALAKIKNVERTVTITTIKKTVNQAEGGVWNFANGGMISAANGLYTSNGPMNYGPFMFGDNSGGRELLAFIPKDGHKADKILDMIDAQLGRKRGGGGVAVVAGADKDITVPIVINIGDQQFSFTRKYRIRQGRDIAQQVY